MQEKSAHTLLGAFILVGLLIAVGLTLLVAGQGYDSRLSLIHISEPTRH